MSKLSRKLLISVLSLVFALVTLGTTTFAWFTLTGTVAVDSIDMNVSAGYGIEISVDGGNTYKNLITMNDLKAALGLSSGVSSLKTLESLTTNDGINFYTLDEIGKTSPTSTTNGYLQFDIWFRTTTQNAKVYLDNGTSITSTAKNWISDAAFTYKKYDNNEVKTVNVSVGETVPVYAANSARFSFQEMVYSGTNLVGKEDGLVTIWELNPDISNNTNTLLGTEPNASLGLVSYWNAKYPNDNLLNYYYQDVDNKVVKEGIITLPQTVKSNSNLGSSTIILNLDQTKSGDNTYKYGYLRVRIWLEGWDPDNFDAIFDTNLKVKYVFSLTV